MKASFKSLLARDFKGPLPPPQALPPDPFEAFPVYSREAERYKEAMREKERQWEDELRKLMEESGGTREEGGNHAAAAGRRRRRRSTLLAVADGLLAMTRRRSSGGHAGTVPEPSATGRPAATVTVT